MSTNHAIPAADPVLTGDLAEVTATYHCHRCHEDFAFLVVMGFAPPPKMPHAGCQAAAATVKAEGGES